MKRLLLAFGLLGLALASCRSTGEPERPRPGSAGHEYFVTYVKPIFEMQCVRCHQGGTPPAGLSLTRREGVLAPRADGRRYLVAGDPDASLLLTSVMRNGTHPLLMPKLQVTLTDDEVGVLHEWIEDGAGWPDAPAGLLRARHNPENP